MVIISLFLLFKFHLQEYKKMSIGLLVSVSCSSRFKLSAAQRSEKSLSSYSIINIQENLQATSVVSCFPRDCHEQLHPYSWMAQRPALGTAKTTDRWLPIFLLSNTFGTGWLFPFALTGGEADVFSFSINWIYWPAQCYY